MHYFHMLGHISSDGIVAHSQPTGLLNPTEMHTLDDPSPSHDDIYGY